MSIRLQLYKKETWVLATIKLDHSAFTAKIYHAGRHYITLCRRQPPKSGADRRAAAESAAMRQGLQYPNDQVEPLVIVAIIAMGTSSKIEAERAAAVSDAWETYNREWRVLH